MTTTQSLHAVYINRRFVGDLRGAVFGGHFVDCDFSDADLAGAELSGEFTSCTFNATWRRATCTGMFIDCEET